MLYLLLIFAHIPIELPIYTPLLTRHAATSPTGLLYVLDRDNARILPFSPDGVSLPPIAREGDGPGELRYPYSIAWAAEHLVIQDHHGLNLFRADGTFARRLLANQEMLVKTRKGMVTAGFTFANRYLPDPVGVFAVDSAEERHKLFSVPRAKQGTMTVSYQDEGILYYVPASARMWLLSSVDGSRVFYYPSGGQLIHVVDGTTHQLRDPIRLPVPFSVNKAWAQQVYDTHMASIAGKVKFKVKLTIPDHYPALRYMNLIKDILYVVQWSGAPDRDFPVLAYTGDGRPTKPLFTGRQVPQIIGGFGDRIWSIGWDATKEAAYVALVDPAALDDFIADYPIPLSDWKQ